MGFVIGTIVGGLMWSIVVYFIINHRYETRINQLSITHAQEVMDSYDKGYKLASELERRAIMETIEQLANKQTGYDSYDELSESSET